MISLADRGLTTVEIGKMLGCSHSNVVNRFAKVGYTPERLKMFKTRRADIFAEKQRQIINAMDGGKLQKSSGYQLAGMIGTLHGIERLERGESTQNLAYADMTKNSTDIDTEIANLQEEIKQIETTIEIRVETPYETKLRQQRDLTSLQTTDIQTLDNDNDCQQINGVEKQGVRGDSDSEVTQMEGVGVSMGNEGEVNPEQSGKVVVPRDNPLIKQGDR